MKKVLNWVRTHKRIALVLLLFIGFTATSTAYAYWNSLQDTDTVTVDVGDGVSIELDLQNVIANNELVPAGQAILNNQVDEIVVTYTVSMDKGLNTGSGLFDLNVLVSKQFNGDPSSSLNAYLNVDFTPTYTGIDVDSTEEVVFTITLVMDENTPAADVTAIKNGTFIITIDFELTPQATTNTEVIPAP